MLLNNMLLDDYKRVRTPMDSQSGSTLRVNLRDFAHLPRGDIVRTEQNLLSFALGVDTVPLLRA